MRALLGKPAKTGLSLRRISKLINCKSTARALQRARYESLDGIRANANADGALLEQVAAPDDAGRTLFTEVAEALSYRRLSTGV